MRVTLIIFLVFAAVAADLDVYPDVVEDSCVATGTGTVSKNCPSPSSGLSLLSLRATVRRQTFSSAAAVSSSLQLAAERSVWLEEHAHLRTRVKDAGHDFDKFIADSKASTDACSARTLQAGKMLSHLSEHTVALSEQIAAQQEVISIETVNLNNTERSIADAIVVFDAAIADCEEERAEASQRNAQYKSELKELEQIAEPAVRADVADDVTAHAADVAKAGIDAVKANATGAAALLTDKIEKDEWSFAQCRAFVRWAVKRDRQPANTTEDSCDEKKEELQETFTEAHEELTEMEAEAAKEMVDKSCDEAAQAEHDAALVPLNAQRERATDKIEEATGAVAALSPVLELMEERLKEVERLVDSIKTECTDSTEVTEYLEAVRELISDTAKCPGMSTFKLEIPKKGGFEFCDQTWTVGETVKGSASSGYLTHRKGAKGQVVCGHKWGKSIGVCWKEVAKAGHDLWDGCKVGLSGLPKGAGGAPNFCKPGTLWFAPCKAVERTGSSASLLQSGADSEKKVHDTDVLSAHDLKDLDLANEVA